MKARSTPATARSTARLPGALVAGITALVSGVSVFVNSYGVHALHQPAVYTTAKNLVAAVLLATGALVVHRRRRGEARPASLSGRGPAGWAGLAYVGVVGGGLAFVLFFTGLARTTAEPAAFLHDTLVLWVAVLAWPALRERLSPWNVAAVGLLVVGQVAVTGGVGPLVAGTGELLVLSATVLWAVETVVAKRLLVSVPPSVLATVRMGVGAVALVCYVAVTGHAGILVGLDAHQLGWVVLTGGLLALYVSSWMVALARARALDVTSVLVGSVVVTALLDAVSGHGGLGPEVLGLALVGAGTATVLWAWPRPVVPA